VKQRRHAGDLGIRRHNRGQRGKPGGSLAVAEHDVVMARTLLFTLMPACAFEGNRRDKYVRMPISPSNAVRTPGIVAAGCF
jgi:hypothetical protein